MSRCCPSATCPPTDCRLYNLKDSDGKELDAESHKDCPGHTAFLNHGDVLYFCADPEKYGHTSRYGHTIDPSGGTHNPTQEEAAEQRRETIANNKLAKAATTVRRDFVKTLLARKKAPDGALWVIIEALASGGPSLRRQMERGHKEARPLLGLPASDVAYGPAALDDLLDMLHKATDDRVVVIALGLVLAAYEDATYKEMWRNPASQTGMAHYFKLLEEWGYGLSEIEQLVVDAVEARADELAKAKPETGTADGDTEAA